MLLVIIYLAFISLGLPDSLLGSAWPSMYAGLGVPIDSAGVLSMIISAGTILSSLASSRLIRRFGTGLVTLASVGMTAVALLGFALSHSFWLLCVFAVPLGLGAGSVDAALNNFVALHYQAKHMSWLHCFWGIGASVGPVIMALSLARWQSWNAGYGIISLLQFALVAALVASLPLWKRVSARAGAAGEATTGGQVLSIPRLVGLPGAKQVLLVFFCYCGLEATVGLWAGSYLVTVRGISAASAASWVSLYYFGITFGRFLSGFLAMRLRPRRLVLLGQCLIGVGILVFLLPLGGYWLLAGLFLIGLGCAPVYPNLIHETPHTFGSVASQSMIGLQVASAYVGTLLLPPLFGLLGQRLGYGLFPVYAGALLLFMACMMLLPASRAKSPEEAG